MIGIDDSLAIFVVPYWADVTSLIIPISIKMIVVFVYFVCTLFSINASFLCVN